MLQRSVTEQPNIETGPDQADDTENHERLAPAVRGNNGHYDRRGDGAAQAGEAMRDTLGEAAFRGRHPVCERARRCRKCASLTDAEQDPEHDQRSQAPGKTAENRRNRPNASEYGQHQPRPVLVGEPTAQDLHSGVGIGKG